MMGGFGNEFWTPQTVVLVGVTVVLLLVLFAAVGYILFVLLKCAIGSLLPVQKEFLIDEVFGELQRENCGRDRGAWEGTVPFYHDETRSTTMQLSILSGDGPPTETQRELFRQIVKRYPSMWPEIAQELVSNHPRLKTVEAITQHIGQPHLVLDPILPGKPLSWSLQYSFDAENEGEFCDYCGYFVEFTDWKIIGVDVAD